VALAAIGADEVAGILALDRARVASTETMPERVRSAAGLIAGTVPTKSWPGYAARSSAIASVEAVLQAMTITAGSKRSMSLPNSPTRRSRSASSSQPP